MAIYKITHRASGSVRLVAANNKAQAIRHVAADELAIETASATMVGQLMTAGAKLEVVDEATGKAGTE